MVRNDLKMGKGKIAAQCRWVMGILFMFNASLPTFFGDADGLKLVFTENLHYLF